MWRDAAYLLDILLAGRRAQEFTAALTLDAFRASQLHQHAVMRNLEIVGEAARKVSRTTKEAHTEIPWSDLVGLRNRLVHEYFRIDVDKVWDVVVNNLPALLAAVEPLVVFSFLEGFSPKPAVDLE